MHAVALACSECGVWGVWGVWGVLWGVLGVCLGLQPCIRILRLALRFLPAHAFVFVRHRAHGRLDVAPRQLDVCQVIRREAGVPDVEE